jgi:hypothetical protein
MKFIKPRIEYLKESVTREDVITAQPIDKIFSEGLQRDEKGNPIWGDMYEQGGINFYTNERDYEARKSFVPVFEPEIEKISDEIMDAVKEYNHTHKYSQLNFNDESTYGFKKPLMSFYMLFPIEYSDSQVIKFDDALDAVYHIQTDGGTWQDLSIYLEDMKRIREHGGVIYRLVYLKDENSLNKEKLGNSWTANTDSTDEFYHDYFKQFYKEHMKDAKPYILRAKIPGGIARFNNLDRAREQEIFISNEDQHLIELIDIKPYNK